MKVSIENNIITIINENTSIDIPICEIKAIESRIASSNISLTKFAYWVTISHELIINTKTNILSFIYPIPWFSYNKTKYNEIFQLIDMNIPNYKCTLIGDINHINKDIEYYIKHKKRLPIITRLCLFITDLPLPMKFLYILILFSISILFVFLIFVMSHT